MLLKLMVITVRWGERGKEGQGQDGRAAGQLSRRNLWVPGEAEDNLDAAELRIPCLAQVLQQQHSSEDAQQWQGNQEPSVPRACRAACLPWSCPPALCLQLSGSETPCLGWDSIFCNQVHLSFRALAYCARRESFPSLEGLHRQSKQDCTQSGN